MNKLGFRRILRNFKLNKYIILLIIIILFHIVNNIYIITVDTTPIYADHAENLANSVEAYSDIKNGKIIKAITYHYGRYPNLFFWLTSISYTLFGISKQAAQITSIIPLVILIFSIYGIGTKLHSKKMGVLAAFIVTTFPHVFSMSRYYTLDFNEMAFLALSIFTFLATNKFTSTWKSIFFGVCLGLTTLTRPSFTVFFIGPFLAYLFHSFFSKKEGNHKNYKKKIVNLTLSLTIALFIALSWWNIPYFINRFQDASLYLPSSDLSKTDLSDPLEFNVEKIMFYITTLASFQIFYYYFIIFFFAIIYFIFFKKKNRFFLLSGFFIPYLFFTFYVYHYPNMRFIFPYLIFIALIISQFLFSIKNIKIRRCIVIITLLIGVTQFCVLTYIPEANPFFLKINSNLKINYGTDVLFSNEYEKFRYVWHVGILSPYTYEWNYDKMLEIINESRTNDENINVGIFIDSWGPLMYINKITKFESSGLILKDPYRKSSIIRLNEADFLIVQKFTNNLGEISYFELEEYMLSNFSLIGEIQWPFNITIEIYKKE